LFADRKVLPAGAALGVLPFWLPLISCLHGMISSEILQLGPDTVRHHPDTDILCFAVTTSGGRHLKTEARRRWMPIRKELLDLGLMNLVDDAKGKGWKTLWQAVEDKEGDIDAVSQQVSSFWADFARKDLKIIDPQKRFTRFDTASRTLPAQSAPATTKKSSFSAMPKPAQPGATAPRKRRGRSTSSALMKSFGASAGSF
jgi:hypothetical protein